MTSWFGNAIGAGIGLVAILLGALWNAFLVRTRDRKMREEEVKSIASAIGAEMAMSLQFNMGKMTQVGLKGVDRTKEVYLSLEPIVPVVWPKMCDKIGWLEASLSYDVVDAWTRLDWHAALLKVSTEEARNGVFNEVTYLNRCRHMVQDHEFIGTVIFRLTGKKAPEPMLPPKLEFEQLRGRRGEASPAAQSH